MNDILMNGNMYIYDNTAPIWVSNKRNFAPCCRQDAKTPFIVEN